MTTTLDRDTPDPQHPCINCEGPTVAAIFDDRACPKCNPFDFGRCGICGVPRYRCSC